MYSIYKVLTRTASAIIRHLWTAKWWQRRANREGKFYKFVMGQQGLLFRIATDMGEVRPHEVYWFHVASLGEYAALRPIIRSLRSSHPGVCIVLTVFSPSGYEVLCREAGTDGAPHFVYYLPFDTPSNVRSFLDAVRPRKAVFVISEYWPCYLHELGRRGIPTYIESMLVGRRSYLFRWYASFIRKALSGVTTFMVQNETSRVNLRKMGFQNVEVVGDPLFDNALDVAQTAYRNTVIEKFCQTAPEGVFIAGSISDERDLQLVASLSDANPQLKCIFVPHEISEEQLNTIKYELRGYTLLYSE